LFAPVIGSSSFAKHLDLTNMSSQGALGERGGEVKRPRLRDVGTIKEGGLEWDSMFGKGFDLEIEKDCDVHSRSPGRGSPEIHFFNWPRPWSLGHFRRMHG
jgi:hypothetical protein